MHYGQETESRQNSCSLVHKILVADSHESLSHRRLDTFSSERYGLGIPAR